MTLRDLMENINVQGNVKIQCYENEDYPEVYYEDSVDCCIPCELNEYLEREVAYMFPYMLCCGKVYVGGICIEVKTED